MSPAQACGRRFVLELSQQDKNSLNLDAVKVIASQTEPVGRASGGVPFGTVLCIVLDLICLLFDTVLCPVFSAPCGILCSVLCRVPGNLRFSFGWCRCRQVVIHTQLAQCIPARQYVHPPASLQLVL